MALITWWYEKYKLKVQLMTGGMKFSLSLAEHRNVVTSVLPRKDIQKYRAMKQHAVAVTLKILTHEEETNALTFFKTQKKKDDLSDAYLMCLSSL